MKPTREPARNNGQTYFVTFQTAERRPFFRYEKWAALLLATIKSYQEHFALHDFVIMHDHVHLLMTPYAALEKSVQLIKGGYSFKAKRQFNWTGNIWQVGFTDHRIRDFQDWVEHRAYIKRNIQSLGEDLYRYCGAYADVSLIEIPQWLKPQSEQTDNGRTEVRPLQSHEHG